MIFFRLLSRFPLKVLYGISDVLYFSLFHIIRYRRRVVLDNLRHSFPDKSPTEIRLIMKGFYHNLADLFVETLKLPSLTAQDLRARVKFTNAALVLEQLQAGQVVIVMASHQSNWEWLPSAAVLNGMPADSIYKPLTSPFFEKLMQSVRSIFGAVPVPMNNLPRRMATHKNVPRIIALVADQVPNVPEQAYWTDFLHQDTPFYPGTERLARSRNFPVFYVELARIRRGYYEATFTQVGKPPYDKLPAGTLLEHYRDLLEATIQKYPSDWLWSHKRWKHWREKYAKVNAKLD